MQEIVKSEIHPNAEKNQLAKINSDYSGASILETFIDMSEAGAKIIRVDSAGENKSFGLAAATMDDACAVWSAFRAECFRIDCIESVRALGISMEVASICDDYPDIEVKKHGDGERVHEWWSVSVEKLNCWYDDDIHTVDDLLKVVQGRKAKLDERWRTTDQIKVLAKEHPEITLKKEPTNFYGKDFRFVNAKFGTWTMTTKSGHTPEDVLEAIQAAIEEVNAEKAKQEAEQDAIEQRAREVEAAVVELELYEIASQTDANAPIKLSSYCQLPDGARTWCLNFAPLGWADMDQSDPVLMQKLVKEAEQELDAKAAQNTETPSPVTPAVAALFDANKSVSPEEKVNLF
jgi:hypothetical protein